MTDDKKELKSAESKAKPMIFISYKRCDAAFANHLWQRLNEMGYYPWIDTKEIRATGPGFRKAIEEALGKCDILIGVMTPESVVASNVVEEWDSVKNKKKPFILVKLQECPAPYGFGETQYLDFTSNDKEPAFQKLRDELRDVLPPNGGPPGPTPPGVEPSALIPIQTFRLTIDPLKCSMLVDGRQRLWLNNNEVIEVFSLASPNALDRWLLPSKEWKTNTSIIWKGTLINSDWYGNVYRHCLHTVRGDRRTTELHSARFDDTPVHCMAAGSSGLLATASWDGRIRVWAETGNTSDGPTAEFRVPYLPLKLFVCRDGRVALIDQSRHFRIFSPAGEPLHAHPLKGEMTGAWQRDIQGFDPLFLLIIDGRRCVLLNARDYSHLTQDFSIPVRGASTAEDPEGDFWTALAGEDGVLHWLSWQPLRLIESYATKPDFSLRSFSAKRDPKHPDMPMAIGITEDGTPFTIQNRIMERYPIPKPAERYAVDDQGEFIYCIVDGTCVVYRNPLIAQSFCNARIESVDGKLVVGHYYSLKLLVQNTGDAEIGRISVRLSGEGRIEPNPTPPTVLEQSLAPNETATISISARAIASGPSLPLEVEMELRSNAGEVTTLKQPIEILSEAAV